MDKKKIALGIPIGSFTDPSFALSLAGLCHYRSDKYDLMAMYHSRGCYITQNRNRVVDFFLERKEADWLLQLDTDISFEANLVDRLCDLADETSSKVVLGWYQNKMEMGIMPLTYMITKMGFTYTKPFGDQPFRLDGAGTGCLLVHKEVYEKVKRDSTGRIFYFGDTAEEFPGSDEHKPLGEDLMFCLNCKKAGYDIYTRGTLKVGHNKIAEI